MDLGKVHYFEKVEKNLHREFINAHNHCVLCGSVLELQHLVVDDGLNIKEEAHCPACEIRTRAKIYPLL